MAIQFHSPSLIPALTALRLDLAICSSALSPVNYANSTPQPEPAFHQHTILLSFLPATPNRLRLKALAHSANATTVHHAHSIGAGAALRAHLAAVDAGFANVALALPKYSAPVAKTVTTALASLASSIHATSIIAAVAPDPYAWQALASVNAWVSCGSGGCSGVEAVEHVTSALSTLASPIRYNCEDESAVADVFGTAADPAVALRALWLPEREEMLWLPASSAVRLSSVTHAIAFLLSPHVAPGVARPMHAALRALLPHPASLWISVNESLPHLPLSSAFAIPVVIICR